MKTISGSLHANSREARASSDFLADAGRIAAEHNPRGARLLVWTTLLALVLLVA